MNKKYLFHPRDFALGLTEKFYTNQAAKGWQLEERGAFLSRFAKAEPQEMRYRVEVISPKAFEEWDIPDEQVAVYEDCGWEYVTGKNFIHVFRAPANSDAQEFYLDPAQQADTLKKLRKNYRSALIWAPLYLIFYTAFITLVSGHGPERWLAQIYEYTVTQTGLMAASMLAITWGMVDSLWATVHLGRIYRRMKKGIPLDHSPKGRGILQKAFKGVMFTAAILSLVLWAFSFKTYPMPQVPDGPYLILADFGYEGERVPNMFNHKESAVRHQRSLLCESWDCEEFVDDQWMYHEIYRIPNETVRERFIWSLMTNSTFAESAEDYVPIQIEGLDKAWVSPRLECVGVKGDYVCFMTHPFYNRVFTMEEALKVLAQRWQNLA